MLNSIPEKIMEPHEEVDFYCPADRARYEAMESISMADYKVSYLHSTLLAMNSPCFVWRGRRLWLFSSVEGQWPSVTFVIFPKVITSRSHLRTPKPYGLGVQMSLSIQSSQRSTCAAGLDAGYFLPKPDIMGKCVDTLAKQNLGA